MNFSNSVNAIEEKYIIYSQRMRGVMIDGLVHLERMIDIFLTQHFCGENKDRQKELMSMLIATERVSFENKRQILDLILNKHHKDFLVENPKFCNRITKVITARNVFAHHELDIADNAINLYKTAEAITFLKFNAKGQTVVFLPVEMEAHVATINECISKITSLFRS